MKFLIKKLTVIKFLVAISILLIGCQGETSQPTANPSPPGTLWVMPTMTADLEGYPYITQSRMTPRSDYPPPGLIPPTTTSPSPTTTAVPTSIPTESLPYVISIEKLTCPVSGAYARCDDPILGMEFEYPVEWGEIEATLQRGDTGREYLYRFSMHSMPDFYEHAGGLSRDFSAGREGSFTSFKGFGDEGGCQYYDGASLFECDEIGKEIILAFINPPVDWICGTMFGSIYSPLAMIAINLPENPNVNGFVFVVPYLSEQMQTDLRNQADAILGDGCSKANPTTAAQFDTWLSTFIATVMDGTADAVTLSNLEKIYHLVQSIKIK